MRERKTKTDWAEEIDRAEEIKELLDIDSPDAERVVQLCDNLNKHRMGSLYEAFGPAEATRLVERFSLNHL